MKLITLFLILSLLLSGCAETFEKTDSAQSSSESAPATGLEEDLDEVEQDLDLDELDNIEQDINTFDW